MNWTIPGTTLSAPRSGAEFVEAQFQSMFLAGGMVLSQVTSITGLDAYMIQNWVKRGFLAKPEQKRYSLNQLCRIININMLRGVLPMERICGLLSYINGALDDESDDIIDDAQLYFIFVRLAAHARDLDTTEAWNSAIHTVMADYAEPFPGAAQRIEKVLQIMLTAWVATRMRQEAEKMLDEL
ncbi:MAG: DUF1836 domain-containing protein [Oscillospiraceae bacterium]|nr:DUF1836 domain-containing protein [Oscillospiraceae bacterium]